MENTITVNADVLESICGWVINDRDKGADLCVTWAALQTQYGSQVKVYRADHPEGGYLNEYHIDPETFFSIDLPALKESNEIDFEEYND